MKEFEFEVEGIPLGKGRPRFARRGSFIRTYTPKKTHDYEHHIAEAYVYNGGTLFDYPYLAVSIIAYFPIPKSARKADRLLMETGNVWHNKIPDIDNIVKLVLDSLNGIAWEDDKQVVYLKAKKYYGKVPKIVIKIKEIENDNQ
jgi:Holliday junction resolvase RusA-like endonuclease